jgi:hypothetical protein
MTVLVLDVLYNGKSYSCADSLWIPMVNVVPEVLDRSKWHTIRNSLYTELKKLADQASWDKSSLSLKS